MRQVSRAEWAFISVQGHSQPRHRDGIADKTEIVSWLLEDVRADGEACGGWSCTWQSSRKLSNQFQDRHADLDMSCSGPLGGLLQHCGGNITSATKSWRTTLKAAMHNTEYKSNWGPDCLIVVSFHTVRALCCIQQHGKAVWVGTTLLCTGVRVSFLRHLHFPGQLQPTLPAFIRDLHAEKKQVCESYPADWLLAKSLSSLGSGFKTCGGFIQHSTDQKKPNTLTELLQAANECYSCRF